MDELQAAWHDRRPRTADAGTVQLICVRPSGGVHETPGGVEVTAQRGLAGDRWSARDPSSDPDGETAVTLINAIVAELVADGQAVDLVGDNLHVDLDIGVENLPAGSRLRIGGAILRVSARPHTGCSTFRDRFGLDALKWVSTPAGRADRLRGVNCSVEEAGTVRVGDPVEVLERPASAPEPEALTV